MAASDFSNSNVKTKTFGKRSVSLAMKGRIKLLELLSLTNVVDKG